MCSLWLKNQLISIIYTLSRLVSGWKSILNYWICWKEELLPCSSNVTLWRQWKWLCCEHFYEGVEFYVSRKPTPKISAVGRLIDGFLMIIAGDENFSAKSSHSLADAMPKESWYCDNNLYGAIVILSQGMENIAFLWIITSSENWAFETCRNIKLGFTLTKNHCNIIFMFFIEYIKA